MQEITLSNAPNPQENEGNDGSDNETIENNTHAMVDKATFPPNTIQHGNLTVDNVTRLIQRHGLPEAVVSDVQNFQQVFFQGPDMNLADN